MTSKDPAEDKLIASIQKTKAQAAGQSDKCQSGCQETGSEEGGSQKDTSQSSGQWQKNQPFRAIQQDPVGRYVSTWSPRVAGLICSTDTYFPLLLTIL